jgi:2-oxoglutarate dehydrogenase E1 component
VEQLYPFDLETAKKILAGYKSAVNFVWAQEEPLNMGAWMFVRDSLDDSTNAKVKPFGRPSSGTTAEGSTKAHLTEQSRIINDAINWALGKN